MKKVKIDVFHCALYIYGPEEKGDYESKHGKVDEGFDAETVSSV